MKQLSAFFIIGLLLATACSKQASNNTQQDACTILPKSVAEEVLGVVLQEPKAQSFGQNPRQTVISNCLFVSPNNDAAIKSLTFMVRIGGVSSSAVNPADGLITTMRQQFGASYNLKKLTDLGDGAVWDDSLKQLTVFKGTSTYVWTSPGATVPDLETKLVTLARKTVTDA